MAVSAAPDDGDRSIIYLQEMASSWMRAAEAMIRLDLGTIRERQGQINFELGEPADPPAPRTAGPAATDSHSPAQPAGSLSCDPVSLGRSWIGALRELSLQTPPLLEALLAALGPEGESPQSGQAAPVAPEPPGESPQSRTPFTYPSPSSDPSSLAQAEEVVPNSSGEPDSGNIIHEARQTKTVGEMLTTQLELTQQATKQALEAEAYDTVNFLGTAFAVLVEALSELEKLKQFSLQLPVARRSSEAASESPAPEPAEESELHTDHARSLDFPSLSLDDCLQTGPSREGDFSPDQPEATQDPWLVLERYFIAQDPRYLKHLHLLRIRSQDGEAS